MGNVDKILDFHNLIDQTISNISKEEEMLTLFINVGKAIDHPLLIIKNSFKEGKMVDHLAAAIANCALANKEFALALEVAQVALKLRENKE